MQQTDATDRNYIKVLKSGVAEYACDMNNNGIYNEDADGQGVACAMNSRDLMAYLDFAGLRPMTELEYEKICRGPNDPVPNEFAWGSTYFLNGAGFLAGTGGTPEERPATAGVNIMTNSTAATGKLYVARNGVFANDSSGRVVSGATYWGVMEMTGNLWEYIIGVMNATGRAYTGSHGDGRLALSGDHDVANWPDVTNPHFGFGLRGGSVVEAAAVGSVHAVSSRVYGWWNSNPGNSYNVGGRGVRTIK
jgi:formylglycine-generating enzyme required for sulfatase activity